LVYYTGPWKLGSTEPPIAPDPESSTEDSGTSSTDGTVIARTQEPTEDKHDGNIISEVALIMFVLALIAFVGAFCLLKVIHK
jgi:hypothetical protein